MYWQVIDSGLLSAEDIMAKDASLLNQLNETSAPILHLYEWDHPSLTYGYFTKPSHHLHEESLKQFGIQQARRPTGGGIIFHLTDLAFSILVPAHHPRFSVNTLANYAFINEWTAEIIKNFTFQQKMPSLLAQELTMLDQECCGFCMAKPTQYDLMLEGKKVGGAAQRRIRAGLLHQASISLTFPPLAMLKQVLKRSNQVLSAMLQQSHCLLGLQASEQELCQARHNLKEELKRHIHSL